MMQAGLRWGEPIWGEMLRDSHDALRRTGLKAGAKRHIERREMSENTVPRPLAIARWLEITAAFVVVIVLVGGITRLTESGLSITEWNVATGVLPPLSETEWQAEFAKYRETPEYRLEASVGGMSLADFKFIFFWEWFHRLLARLVGVVYALPLIWFWVKGAMRWSAPIPNWGSLCRTTRSIISSRSLRAPSATRRTPS